MEFREPLTVSILSERRAFQPYGLAGGGPGQRGMNTLVLKNEDNSVRLVSLGGKNTVDVIGGTRLIIESPGGGGYGPEATSESKAQREPAEPLQRIGGGSLAEYTASQESA